jgi:copper type II ascorbate-dependent monooxygenase-like protein
MGLLALAGCSSGGHGSTPNAGSTSTFSLRSTSVAVNAGQEKYVCYAQTLDADLAIDRFDYAVVPNVHHIFMSRAMQPEPEGLSECDVLFKTSWSPLFVAGKGDSSLQYPQGAAAILPKGTQLVMQLHLLNASASDATVSAQVVMRRTSIANPQPVGLYAFGTEQLAIAPNGTTTSSYECTPNQDVMSIALFPHMHRLGTRLTLEAADSTGAYQAVFTRDPYDFNNQYMDQSKSIQITKGTKTRINCTYDNPTSATVDYGESTTQEMCFLIAFVVGQDGLGGCVNTPPAGDGGAPTSGSKCMATPTASGIGASCTAGGGECASGLQCSADVGSSGGSTGICLKVGCAASSDCGSGATCCAPAQAGGAIKVCLPSECVPSDCTPAP